jgi:hypothetical protein
MASATPIATPGAPESEIAPIAAFRPRPGSPGQTVNRGSIGAASKR